MEKLMKQNATVDLLGRAVISRSIRHICPYAFDGSNALRSVHVPGTVKKIDTRAFADCVNLKAVTLDEGITSIAGNVFTGCSALRSLVIPDSIQQLDGWAFYQFTGLQEPAYNRSKTILYCYPCTATEPVFTVPTHVKRINAAAFLGNPHLQQVKLPEGLAELETRTFLDIGIRRVIVPASVKRIQARAFWNCKNLEEVVILGKETVIEEEAFFCCPQNLKITSSHTPRLDEQLHLLGRTFLVPVRLDPPKKDHSKNPAFLRLANACASADAHAMWEMAAFLMRWEASPSASVLPISGATGPFNMAIPRLPSGLQLGWTNIPVNRCPVFSAKLRQEALRVSGCGIPVFSFLIRNAVTC